MDVIDGAAFYKTCFVVPDLAAAANRWSAGFGFSWLKVGPTDLVYDLGGVPSAVTSRALITRDRPRIHLIEEVPGTPWMSSASGAAHHVAYWVPDLPDAVAQLTSLGFVVECSDSVPAGPQQWAYLIDPLGVRVEVLARFGEDPEAMIDGLPPFEPGSSY